MQKLAAVESKEATCGVTIHDIDELFRFFAAFYRQSWTNSLPPGSGDLTKMKSVWFDCLSSLKYGYMKSGVTGIKDGRAFINFAPTPTQFNQFCRSIADNAYKPNFPELIKCSDRTYAKEKLREIWKILRRKPQNIES